MKRWLWTGMKMEALKRIGSTRLAFWLLMGVTALLVIGSLYSRFNPELFRALNDARVQEWLGENLLARFSLVWWVPALFLAMGGLGVNLAACALLRTMELWGQRGRGGGGAWALRLLPTAIHLLFIVTLLGHLVTFTLGRWDRVDISEGAVVRLGSGGASGEVKSVEYRHFPEDSPLADRLLGASVALSVGGGEEVSVSYLQPVKLQGRRILLDMAKGRKRLREEGSSVAGRSVSGDSGQKAGGVRGQAPGLRLLVVDDPGFPVVIAGFFGILVLLGWYYLAKGWRARRRSVTTGVARMACG